MRRIEKLIRAALDPIWRDALIRYGVAAGVENYRALEGLQISTVVDIGANRGQFSLLARRLFYDANIIAFEPLRAAAKTYGQIFGGDKRVVLHEVAIGESSGMREMHIAAADDSSSLLPIGHGQISTFPGTQEIGTTLVPVNTLDEKIARAELRPPALLKLDVQGFELRCLKGAEKLLSSFDYVYCECSFREMYRGQALAGEVVDWLGRRDLLLIGVYNATYDRTGKCVQGDFLFARN